MDVCPSHTLVSLAFADFDNHLFIIGNKHGQVRMCDGWEPGSGMTHWCVVRRPGPVMKNKNSV